MMQYMERFIMLMFNVRLVPLLHLRHLVYPKVRLFNYPCCKSRYSFSLILKLFAVAIGGARNWDYRYTWIRDASFTIYAFLRLGLTDEADQYMQFIKERCDDLVRPTVIFIRSKFYELTPFNAE
jgi:Glycosyl hydrolases family 15